MLNCVVPALSVLGVGTARVDGESDQEGCGQGGVAQKCPSQGRRDFSLRLSTSILTEDLTCVPPLSTPAWHILCDPSCPSCVRPLACPTCPLLLPVAPWSDHQDLSHQSATQPPSVHVGSVALSLRWAFFQHARPPHPHCYLQYAVQTYFSIKCWEEK